MALRATLACALAAASMTAAGENAAYRQFADEHLAAGRSLWIANCEGCHGYGIAGAPVPMEPSDWRPRLAKGRTVLYDHAINGFFGPDDTLMPERGGNPELTDAQVKAAVDYMTALAGYYIQQKR
ncbi:MAG: cytochrome c5 family protein [Thiogranum sp.]|nr:cytochrome c5 family protein [Thiogranum sp.]